MRHMAEDTVNALAIGWLDTHGGPTEEDINDPDDAALTMLEHVSDWLDQLPVQPGQHHSQTTRDGMRTLAKVLQASGGHILGRIW
jgi:hypothetical protein